MDFTMFQFWKSFYVCLVISSFELDLSHCKSQGSDYSPDGLGKFFFPCLKRAELDPVSVVFIFVPSCADPENESPSRKLVESSRHPAKQGRIAKTHRRNKRAEFDTISL